LKYSQTGELVDDDDANDSDSAEGVFATELTRNYDQLSLFFPILGRLKELYKISAMFFIIQNFYIQIQNQMKNLKINKNEISKNLLQFRKSFKYPLYTVTTCDKLYSETLKQNNVVNYQLTNQQRTQLKNKINCAIYDQEEKLVKNINDVVKEMTDNSVNVNIVKNWLDTNNDSNIVYYIERAIHGKQLSKFNQIIDQLHTYGINNNNDNLLESFDNINNFRWIPAIYNFDRSDGSLYRVYGGVNMRLNLVRTTLLARINNDMAANNHRIHQQRINQHRINNDMAANNHRINQQRINQHRINNDIVANNHRINQHRINNDMATNNHRINQQRINQHRINNDMVANNQRMNQQRINQQQVNNSSTSGGNNNNNGIKKGCGQFGGDRKNKNWVYGSTTSTITGERLVLHKGYKSVNPNANTTYYWKPYDGIHDHFTLHKNGVFHAHFLNGDKTEYRSDHSNKYKIEHKRDGTRNEYKLNNKGKWIPWAIPEKAKKW
jgi:hypothetical protein